MTQFIPFDENIEVNGDFPEVILDESKPNRRNGNNESWYIVSW